MTSGQWNFDDPEVRVLPGAHGRLRGIQGRPDRFLDGEQRQGLGDRYDFPARQDAAWSSASGCQGCERRADAGVSCSTCAVHSSRIAGCGRPSISPSISRRINQQLLYSQYTRTGSYFENSELKATGLPQGRELAILEPLEGPAAAEVFTTRTTTRSAAATGSIARTSRQPRACCEQAGWNLKGRTRTNAGRPAAHRRDSCSYSPTFETPRAALHRRLQQARHQCHRPHDRYRSVPAARALVRLRYGDRCVRPVDLSWQRAALLLVERCRRPGR